MAVIFSTMQELNLFSSSNPVLLCLASVLKTLENISVPKLAILIAQKSFSRNVISNKFLMKKKEDSRSMLAYFARTLTADRQRTFIVWEMHKEKHFLGRENTSGVLRDTINS